MSPHSRASPSPPTKGAYPTRAPSPQPTQPRVLPPQESLPHNQGCFPHEGAFPTTNTTKGTSPTSVKSLPHNQGCFPHEGAFPTTNTTKGASPDDGASAATKDACPLTRVPHPAEGASSRRGCLPHTTEGASPTE